MGPYQCRHISLDAASLNSALMAKQDLSRPRVNKKPGQAEPLAKTYPSHFPFDLYGLLKEKTQAKETA